MPSNHSAALPVDNVGAVCVLSIRPLAVTRAASAPAMLNAMTPLVVPPLFGAGTTKVMLPGVLVPPEEFVPGACEVIEILAGVGGVVPVACSYVNEYAERPAAMIVGREVFQFVLCNWRHSVPFTEMIPVLLLPRKSR